MVPRPPSPPVSKLEPEPEPEPEPSLEQVGSEAEKQAQPAELTLQDKIDDALDAGFGDAAAIEQLLADAEAAKLAHPSVRSLRNKLETLRAEVHHPETALSLVPASVSPQSWRETMQRLHL